jgi:alpha-galactosidase
MCARPPANKTTSQSWDILYSGYLVELGGFKAGAANTVEFSNPTGFTPDLLRIGVAA